MQDEANPLNRDKEPERVEKTDQNIGLNTPVKSANINTLNELETVTDKAVEDIVQKEADAVLEAEDAELNKAFEGKPKPGIKERIKHLVIRWWKNPKARYGTLAGVCTMLVLSMAIPPSRYFLLNTVGVRASVTATVLDETTRQPLKNVQVNIRGRTSTTDTEGVVRISKVKLGRTKININRRAFAALDRVVVVGLGSNPLGSFDLKAVGAQYTFVLTDLLSGKPIEKGEAISDDLNAVSDKAGKLVLTVDAKQEQDVNVSISAKGYRTEKLNVGSVTTGDQAIKMVVARKHAFVSKRSGKYDLYKIDVDGKNEEVVLAGTGNEQPDISLIAHPSDNIVAFVSTRENIRNEDKFLLSTLTLIDLDDNTSKTIVQAETIQVLGWSGSKLLFSQIVAGASAGNPRRQRILSYDRTSNTTTELANSNNFNDMVIVGNILYYAPSNALLPNEPTGLFKIGTDGKNKQQLFDKEVWTIYRTAYDNLSLSVQQEWYQYKITSNGKVSKQTSPPPNPVSRTYADSQDAKLSLRVEERDGKGTLLLYNVQDASEKVVKQQAGIAEPVHWLNDKTLVYRVRSDQETADYVLSIDGGEARKVRDVTNTRGIETWFYH